MDDVLSNLTVTNPLRRPVTVCAVEALQLPAGSKGLDAGCGVGAQTLILAELVGDGGHVTGLDFSPDILAFAQKVGQKSTQAALVSWRVGDVNQLPFEDNLFDWGWSMDCVGVLPQDPLIALRELKRVVRPDGRVAVLAWTSQLLLPGYPQLEAHLNATAAGLAPFNLDFGPGRHFMRALDWFEQAGFVQLSCQSFAGSAHAPMSRETRAGVEAILQMRWTGVEDQLASADAALYRRLCRADSDDYIVNRPDYAMFFTYTMFSGSVA